MGVALKTQDVSRENGFGTVTELKSRCAKGSLILVFSSMAEHGLRFVNRMIITRLIIPEYVGLMAVITIFCTAFDTLTEVGVKQSIIQNPKGADADYLNTAWWFQVSRGLFIYFAAFSMTPMFVRYYFAASDPLLLSYDYNELALLFRVAFLAIVFACFISPGLYVLQKNIRFGRFALITQGSSGVSIIITIVLIVTMRSAWALVLGFVIEAVLRFLTSFLFCPFKPRFKIDRSSIRQIICFARGMFGIPLFSFIAYQTDIIFIGKLEPMTQLAIYSMAVRLSQVPNILFYKAVSPILLPAFAEKQEDKGALVRNMFLLTEKTTAFVVPFLIFICLYSRSVLKIIYTERYSAAGIALSIMVFSVFITILEHILGALSIGMGRPDLHRRFVMILAGTVLMLIYPAIKFFGITGAAATVFVGSLLGLSTHVVLLSRILNFGWTDYCNRVLNSARRSLLVVIVPICFYVAGWEDSIFNIIFGLVVLGMLESYFAWQNLDIRGLGRSLRKRFVDGK